MTVVLRCSACRCGQAGDQVGEILARGEQLGDGLVHVLADELGIGAGQDDVGVRSTIVVVLVPDAHHLADDLQRQPGGDVLDEVARPGGQQLVDNASAAVRCTSSSNFLIILGVNARETIRRSLACRGSSMLIIEPKYSLNSAGRSSMLVAPRAEENSSGCRLAADTSACETKRVVAVARRGERALRRRRRWRLPSAQPAKSACRALRRLLPERDQRQVEVTSDGGGMRTGHGCRLPDQEHRSVPMVAPLAVRG